MHYPTCNSNLDDWRKEYLYRHNKITTWHDYEHWSMLVLARYEFKKTGTFKRMRSWVLRLPKNVMNQYHIRITYGLFLKRTYKRLTKGK